MSIDTLGVLTAAVAAVPIATIATQYHHIRADLRTFVFSLCYLAYLGNLALLAAIGQPFAVYSLFLDALIVSAAVLAIVNTETARLKIPTTHVFHFVLYYMAMLGMLPLLALASPSNLGTISIILMLIVFVFGVSVVVSGVNRKVGLGIILVLALWFASHLQPIGESSVFGRILTLTFVALVSATMLHHAAAANRKMFYENTFLFKSQRIVLSMLNDISSSPEYMSSVENTLLRVLETVSETLSASGAALYHYREVDGGEPELKFSQAVGKFFPLRREDETTLKYQQIMMDRIAQVTFAVGEGVVGTVARTGQPLLLDRQAHQTQMGELGLDFRHIRSIIAVPFKMKEKLFGVMVAQNCREKPAFDINDQHLLKALADQAGISVTNTNMYVELTQTVRFREEANIATRIQKQLLPESVPKLTNLRISVFFEPAKEVGGDYYDFLRHADGSQGIVIGDVSGKGVPAGMVMAVAKAIVQILAKASSVPRDIVIRFASEMFGNMRTGQFMTFNYVRWDDATRKLTFAGAGHEYLLWFHAGTGRSEKVRAGGLAVGLLEDVTGHVNQEELQLEQGDVIVLYTDGVTEARNAAKDMFTLRRLQSALESYAYLVNPDKILENINRELYDFMGGADQYDDVTMLVLSVQS